MPPGVGPPSLVDRFLVAGEEPVIVVRRHMVVLVRPMAEFLVATALLSALARAADAGPVDTAVGWLLLAVAGRSVYAAVSWDRERITVTRKRLLLTHGVFTANVAVMPVSKITDLSFRQSALGLLLGYGELTIESAGQNQALNVLGFLPEPQRVYETVSRVVHTSRAGGRRDDDLPSAVAPGGPPPDGTSGLGLPEPDDLLLPPWVNERGDRGRVGDA